MGIYIRDMKKPKGCYYCPLEQLSECRLLDNKFVEEIDPKHCPLIEIDHTNTELLEFFNEFKKWKASKEVAKYINAVYGERRADE